MSTQRLAVNGAPTPGTIIAEKYRVLGVLGSGGMGCVVEAEHLLMKKSVAIKFVLASRSDSARRRLFREAQAAQALSSENVVRVFDLGVHEAAPYIVMELLEGMDLAAQVAVEGPLAVEEAVDGILEACVAVAEAHAVGIIHRDIKPANLFATRTAAQRLVKVLDFGISKVPESVTTEDCEKTTESDVLGTPYYASPEQIRNPANVDARTDVWALGVTLFHLLSGAHPFKGSSAREVIAAIFTDEPADLRARRPEVPEGLADAIEGALAKRPEERTATVAALVDDLLPFASKRGRLAAERIAALESPAEVKAAAAPPPDSGNVLTSTDAGLCSTLPATEKRSAAPSVLESASSRVTRHAPLLGALAIAVLVGVGWLVSSRPHPTALATGLAAVAPALPASAAPLRQAHQPSAGPGAAASTESSPGAAPTTSALRPRPTGRPPRRASAPPASAAASASTASPRRDIDGVPIVE